MCSLYHWPEIPLGIRSQHNSLACNQRTRAGTPLGISPRVQFGHQLRGDRWYKTQVVGSVMYIVGRERANILVKLPSFIRVCKKRKNCSVGSNNSSRIGSYDTIRQDDSTGLELLVEYVEKVCQTLLCYAHGMGDALNKLEVYWTLNCCQGFTHHTILSS